MKTATITGRFIDVNDKPVRGKIIFIPSRLWVNDKGFAWATLAPVVELDSNGSFTTWLTPTHGHDNSAWHYKVICPIDTWTITVKETNKMISIKSLLPEKYRTS